MPSFLSRAALVAVAAVSLWGCRQDMHDQPRYEALEASNFFADGRASRPQVDGTVARGELRENDAYYTGVVNGEFVTELPVPLTRELLLRGQERYNIFCSTCHGRLGDGNGAVSRRGFAAVANYHSDRLRNEPVGYFYDVITNGFGNMFDLSERVPVADRWAIVAYVRALQMSQFSQINELPQAVQSEFRQVVQ